MLTNDVNHDIQLLSQRTLLCNFMDCQVDFQCELLERGEMAEAIVHNRLDRGVLVTATLKPGCSDLDAKVLNQGTVSQPAHPASLQRPPSRVTMRTSWCGAVTLVQQEVLHWPDCNVPVTATLKH